MRRVTIHGAGPAGSAAAVAALACGAEVDWYDRRALPRHKVCGEFLSGEAQPLLESLGALAAVQAVGPAPIRRVRVRLGRVERNATLPEAAWGISRYALDHVLWSSAVAGGARFTCGTSTPGPPCVVATGRSTSRALPPDRGARLFGFKAHFRGPVSDAVELFFFRGGYVGVNPVEGGLTNVCGLARQEKLARFSFDIDAVLASAPALAERVRPLERAFEWIYTGPMVFMNRLKEHGGPGVYRAGDDLAFVDPFTGTGQLLALLTGRLAGTACAQGWEHERYQLQCQKALASALFMGGVVRIVLSSPFAEVLGSFAPISPLYRFTRPNRQ